MPFLGIDIWAIAKIFALIGLTIYLVFAMVMVKQVHLMTRTFEGGFEWAIKLMSYAHLLFAIGVVLFALIIL
jgi:hypothetical protein